MTICKRAESRMRGTSIKAGLRPVSFCMGLVYLSVLVAGITAGSRAAAQANVTTQHNDIYRTGANTNETMLTPRNVNPGQFGKLFSQTVDGLIVAQPLYMSNVNIPGAGKHNVVYVVTEGDSVYAFDADSNGGSNAQPLWHASMLTAAHGAAAGATTVPSSYTSTDITPQYGITGTPVINPSTNTIYLVSFTLEDDAFVLRLHALDITTGAEKFGGPVSLQASVPGIGSGSSGGVLKFDPHWSNQRPGLLLLNGTVYVATAAHGDNGPWHGWLFAYNASTLKQISVFCASPNGTGSGIWMSGIGLAADALNVNNATPNGRLFLATGNGDFNAKPPYQSGMDFGDSILRLDLTGSGKLSIDDAFTPFNQASLDASDGDLGSGGVMVLPDQPGAHPHLMIQVGKDGVIHVVDRDSLGGYNKTDRIVQELPNGATGSTWGPGIWGGPAYWNGNVYFPGRNAPLKAYSLANGALSTNATSQAAPADYSATPSVSANGNTDGIVWMQQYNGTRTAILEAYDASDLSNLLYTTSMNLSRDDPGNPQRFPLVTIANGKVYVRTEIWGSPGGKLSVYGLLAGTKRAATPSINPGSRNFVAPISVSISDVTGGAAIYYTTDGSIPTAQSHLYKGPFTVASTQTITAMATESGYLQSASASATYSYTAQTASPVFSLPANTYSGTQSLSLTDSSRNAVIYYTTNGSTPTAASARYSGPIAISANETVSAMAVAPGLQPSAVVSNAYIIQAAYTVNYSDGFANSAGLKFNGNTLLDDSRLQLTDGGLWEASSAFYTTPVNIQAFTTDFTFQLSNPVADGITFTIQGSGPNALGANGTGLGYHGIINSLAIKFDLYNNAGQGINSTGIFFNGNEPTTPDINLNGSGIDLHSDDTMAVHITYDGANLIMTITDIVTGAVWSTSFQVNIPFLVGGNTAYVGFTGSSGDATSSQKVETWTLTTGAPKVTTRPPVTANFPGGFTSAGLTFNGPTLAGTALQLTDGGSNEARSIYESTKLGVQSFTTDFDFVMYNATADGFTFIIQNQGANAVGGSGGLLGSAGIKNSVAVKFDIYNNNGEGNDSTGIYLNGANPMTPAVDLTSSGVLLSTEYLTHAHIRYDGTNLTLTLTAPSTGATFTRSFPVNIPQVVRGNTAWVGFTAGTGRTSSVIRLRDWTYTTP